MWRALSLAFLALLLLSAGWWLLQDDRAGHAVTAPRPGVAADEVRPVTVAEPEARRDVEFAAPPRAAARDVEPTTALEPLTGVLAGRLVVDGAPLAEAVEMQLDPAGEAHAVTRGALRTDAFGRFRREGLPSDWTGALHLPEPYRLDVTEGGWRTTIPIEHLSADLVIEVERPPALRLRVLRADRTPATELRVSVRQYEQSGWNDNVATTDGAGVLVLRRTAPQPYLVEARARADDGANAAGRWDAEALVPTAPYDDMDLGELVLAEGRTVELHCATAEGVPLADVVVHLKGSDLREQMTTDAAGVVSVGLPWTSVPLELQSDGFETAKIEVPAGATRHDVAFRTASLLRVQVLDRHGQPWVGGSVRISALGDLFGDGNNFPPGPSMRRLRGMRSGSDERDGVRTSYCLIPLDEDATVELLGIEVGREFDLRAEDTFEHVGAQQRQSGLAPGERREVRLQLTRDACALEVHVCDGPDRPLAGAEVSMRGAETSVSTHTDAQGKIVLPALLTPLLTVSARAHGLQEARSEGVDPCAGPLTLTLQPGRRLEVRLRDATGRSIDAGELRLSDTAGSRTFRRERTGVFEGLPFQPLVLTWSLCGRELKMDVDAASESVEFELPTLARAEITLAGWQPGERERPLVRLEYLDAPEFDCATPNLTPDDVTRLALWPGRYRMTALIRTFHPRDPPSTRDHGAPVEVLLEAGAEVAVTLGPAAGR